MNEAVLAGKTGRSRVTKGFVASTTPHNRMDAQRVIIMHSDPKLSVGGKYWWVPPMITMCIEGAYAQQAGHAQAGYHAFELNCLAHIYMRVYASKAGSVDDNFVLFFRPNILRKA